MEGQILNLQEIQRALETLNRGDAATMNIEPSTTSPMYSIIKVQSDFKNVYDASFGEGASEKHFWLGFTECF